jgi:hypothetical protein
MSTETYNPQRLENGNIKFDKEKFNQVCIRHDTIVNETTEGIESFCKHFKDEYGIEIIYLETILTKPDRLNGQTVVGTGGRKDVFFAVDTSDKKFRLFCIYRLQLGIRWIEDVLSSVNYHSDIYPERVFDYKQW